MKKNLASAIEKKAGVYRIQNIVTGNFYIGSSRNLYRRYYSHMQLLRERRHYNTRIKEDCEKYGISSFVFGVVEYCNESEMLEKEQKYFEMWKPFYNVWPTVYDATGRTYTESQIQRFRSINRGPKNLSLFSQKLRDAWVKRREKYTPQELSEKMSFIRKGKPHSAEDKKKMSLAGKGRIFSMQHRENIRKARMGTKLINGKFVKNEGVF